MITKPRVTIEQILKDPAASSWFRNALKSALDRDPVDAANDAALLYRLLDRRAHDIHEELLAKLPPLSEITPKGFAAPELSYPVPKRMRDAFDEHKKGGSR